MSKQDAGQRKHVT